MCFVSVLLFFSVVLLFCYVFHYCSRSFLFLFVRVLVFVL